MQSVESQAKTRQEAIQKALDELGVEMHDVEDITILDEGSKGFLGMGARPVRVRVSVDRPEPRQRGGRQRGGRDRGGEQPRGEQTRGEQPRGEQPRGERGRGRDRNDRSRSDRNRNEKNREGERGSDNSLKQDAPRRDTKARPFRGEEEAPARPQGAEERGSEARGEGAQATQEGEGQSPRRRRSRAVRRPRRGVVAPKSAKDGNGSTGEGREERAGATAPRAERDERAERDDRRDRPRREELAPSRDAEMEAQNRKEEIDVAPITDEQGREAAAMLQEIINKMGLEATVEYARADDGAARLNIASEDSALLIGRKGRNLQAMQYLINRIISRTDANDVTERLIVDIEGYVDRRKAALEELAENMAARAKSAGRDMRLKPMSPQERRIVHLALQNDEEVRTFSLGDSLFRTVVISPRDKRSGGGGGGGGSRDSRRGGRGGARRGGRGRGRGRNPRNEDSLNDRGADAPSESTASSGGDSVE